MRYHTTYGAVSIVTKKEATLAPIEVPSWDELDMDDVCARVGAVAFDLDNTLARSRKPMTSVMANRFSTLTTILPVAVITGGRYSLVVSQVLDVLEPQADYAHLHLMPTSGTRYYQWRDGVWHCRYAHDIDKQSRDAAIASLTKHARRLGLWYDRTWGPRIEDRGSQITFSALGQQAPVEEREAWDPDHSKKSVLAKAVAADLPDLEVRAAGTTSVDVSLRGFDKAYAVRELAEILNIGVGDILFVGDRMTPDGNDYPAAEAGALAVKVSGPEDTIRLCDALIARLS